MWPRRVEEYLRWRAEVGLGLDRLASLKLSAALALIPAIAAGAFAFGWRAPVVVGAAAGAAGAVELIARSLRRDPPGRWGWSWLVAGLVVGVSLPPHAPLWLPALCGAVAVALGQVLFGYRGVYWLPPAGIGILAAHLALPAAMASGEWPVLRGYDTTEGWLAPLEGDLEEAVPRGQYWATMVHGTIPSAPAVLQPTPQALLRAQPSTPLPEANAAVSYDAINLFLGYASGACGGTSGLAWAAATVLLLLTAAAMWRLVLAGLLAFAAGLAVVAAVSNGGIVHPANILPHILTGGFPVAVLYLVGDPATCPQAYRARFLQGAIFGLAAVLQRLLMPPSEDLAFAAVAAMALTPIWDRIFGPLPPAPAPKVSEDEEQEGAPD